MNLTIEGHHLEVTPALREYVTNKLSRPLRHFDEVVTVTVLLTVEKKKEKERRQTAQVTLRSKGKRIFCEVSHKGLYAAIDQLMDKLDRQVCQHKDKCKKLARGAADTGIDAFLHRMQAQDGVPRPEHSGPRDQLNNSDQSAAVSMQ